MNRSQTPDQSRSTHLTYTIGEAADILGVSISTIRMYEREGLIITTRRNSRHRRYDKGDINRLECIRRMINTEKVSIAGIRRLLALIPCWKIKHCPEEQRNGCDAFRRHDAPCWMVSRKSWDCKSAECRSCPVYAEADCHKVKESITMLTLESHTESEG